MRRLRLLGERFADIVFAMRIWVRYDLPRGPVMVLGCLLCSAPLLVSLLVSGPLRSSDVSLAGSVPPVTLPEETIPPVRVFALPRPPAGVLIVGDSLIAGEEELYREALVEGGVVTPVFDAAVSRGLRRGWLCPEGVPTPDPDRIPGPGDCHRQGLDVVATMEGEGRLPQVVVMALGTNDASLPVARVRAAFDDLRVILAERRLVLLATATLPMGEFHERWNATARAWCAADQRCVFVDWVPADASAELFAPDGLHLSRLGSRWRADALAAVVARGL